MSLIKPSWHSSAEWYLDSPTSRHTSGLTPLFLRELAAAGGLNESSLPSLEHPEGVAALTVTQARSLRGPQIDGIIKKKLADVLGTKWLMQAQECWYRPERPVEAGGRNGSSTSSPLHGAGGTGEAHTRDYGKPDIAMLMVDNRPPFAYEVPGTSLRSPDGWGAKRTHITASWRPTEPSTSIFQMALVINHIYAQLHGYRFYLENPCPHVRIGVRKEDWESSVTPKQLVQPKSEWREAMANYTRTDPVCPGLPASHRLGPFPPRGPPWIKIAALRYLLRRHQYIIYLDSDCFVTEVWQPITPLLQSTGLLDGSRWIAAAEEFPPQKLRGDFRAGIANSGVLLLTGAPIAGAKILQSVEEWIWPMGNPTWMFKWPFEQNALTQVVFRRNPERYTLLKPGCPINSPFGALLRHMVGGTPHRAIYHPDHRLPWLVDALQCTLRATNHSGSPAAPPLERCTPNERSLRLDASGCVPHLSRPGAHALRFAMPSVRRMTARARTETPFPTHLSCPQP